jgi:hypothetical protein
MLTTDVVQVVVLEALVTEGKPSVLFQGLMEERGLTRSCGWGGEFWFYHLHDGARRS